MDQLKSAIFQIYTFEACNIITNLGNLITYSTALLVYFLMWLSLLESVMCLPSYNMKYTINHCYTKMSDQEYRMVANQFIRSSKSLFPIVF